jgi:PAS domain S-box-containing protein
MAKNSRPTRNSDALRPRRKAGPARPPHPPKANAAAGNGHLARLETLLGTIREGLIGISRDWRYTYANAAATGLLAHGARGLIGRLVFEASPELRSTPFEEGFRKTMDERAATAFEACYVPRHLWLECRCYPGPDGISVLFTEVTERRQVEQALRQNEEHLRLAMEGGGMGRWGWDVQTDATFWCDRVYELLGLNRLRPPGMETLLDQVHPDDRVTVKKLIAGAINDQTDLEVEFRVLYSRPETNGALPWLASHAKVIRDEHGRALRMIGVMYDITGRKQMEAELRLLNEHLEEQVEAQTEELRDTVERLQEEVVRRVLAEGNLRRRSQMLEAFFEHTITPLVFLDRYFNFVRVNKAYAQAAGEDPASFPGKNYFVLRPHDEDRPIFEQVVRTKQAYFAHARPFADPHNPQRPVTYWDWHLTPLLSDGGQVQALVLNLEDVTEAQQAYAALEHRAEQLQKLTLELSQTEDRERKRLSELFHEDVQQVLAGAKFHLNLLRQQARDREDLRQTAEEVGHMLNEAIGKSRSLSHELSPALYQFDLDEMLAWLGRNMKERHGLAVDVDVRGPIEPPPESLKALLYRVAQELLFNVVKHAGVRRATLRLRRTRGRLRLLVADPGKGFDPAALAGTAGFGLMSIRERLGLLGGRLIIRSRPGRGTAVLVALPEKAASGTPPTDSAG